MNEHWTDFEKYVFGKLEKLDMRLTRVETKWTVLAGITGAIGGLIASLLK